MVDSRIGALISYLFFGMPLLADHIRKFMDVLGESPRPVLLRVQQLLLFSEEE